MARPRPTRKPKQDRADAPDPDLLEHVQSLGLSTVEDYVGWCGRHGFSRRTDKHWRLRLKERSYANRAIADARLAQLLSTKALVAEGRTMKHCVASYAHSCASGMCSIWTLEVETFEGRTKVLTIEVQTGMKLIYQARGKCNMLPGDKHRGILGRWAEQAGLQLAKHV